ncbi:MAG: IS110 family transposase [Verrucomicrobiota bacterium]|nr:IS110 family transposase [Verrucomicrobiota bacterium]
MNANWTEHLYFAALDWAQDHHDIVVVDRTGQIVAELRFAHSAAGWAEFSEKMKPFGGCPIALETCSGPAVDQLLQRGFRVYPVSPKASQRYRDRKLPSGTKTDRHDAWSLADALRTDGRAWRVLHPQDEATATLRTLCRDEITLIEQRTALVNQLRQTLTEYYPVALEIFEDWTQPGAWAFVRTFPTPAQLVAAGKRRWEKFLHTHKLWRSESAPRRLALFAQANALPTCAATTNAKNLLALSLVALLATLQRQLDEYRRRIEQAFHQHPDHELFDSLPGAGPKLAPRLLAELGSQRQVFPDPDTLMCYAGVSPISFQSGQFFKVRVRRACNHVLRHTLHLWADLSRKQCVWAQAYYRAHREKGKSHACALRCLGKRWLKILWRLWQCGERYDEAKHLQNQQRHGSWVSTLLKEQNRMSKPHTA